MISVNLSEYPLKLEVPEKSAIVYLKKSGNRIKNRELLDYILDYLWGKEKGKSDLFIVVYPHLFSMTYLNYPMLYFINEVPTSRELKENSDLQRIF